MTHPLSQPESLLEHGPRLRALARRLVGDGRADDLVQETWVRAVERGKDATPWNWLGRVLRNLASDDRRADTSRVERERAVARGEADSDEGQRFGLHKDLMAAIERLDAPYRQAILLRYFEELPPRKIAARLGLPVKTVKTRLNRGIALLREELDRQSGGRETWLAAMAPLLKASAPIGGILGGVSAALRTSTALQLAGAAAVVSAGLYLALPRAGREPLSPSVPVVSAPDGDESEVEHAVLEATGASSRAMISPSAPGVPAPAALALVSGMRHGRVLDGSGVGIAGVQVGFDQEGGPEPVVSGAGGAFELPELNRQVSSRDPRYATVLASRLDPERAAATDEHVVVVAPAVDLGGVVRDEHGAPAAHVGVRMEIPLSFRGRFREILDHAWERDWSAETDEQGRFLLAGAPGLACAKLVAWAGHTKSEGVPVPETGALDLELVLTIHGDPPPGPDALRLVGEVRHASGALASGALVSRAGVWTRTDGEGLFELFVPRNPRAGRQMTLSVGGRILGVLNASGGPEPTAGWRSRRSRAAMGELVAAVPGEQAAILAPERDAGGTEVWPSFVTLWLGADPLSIGGRVLGTDGLPLADAPVWADDLTFAGATQEGFLTLEHEMAGKSDQWMDRWFCVRTDGEGRFELGGLGERGYTLAAMDPATLQIVQVGPVAAGSSGVELALPGDELLERVAGRVVDTHGEVPAGLSVSLERRTFGVRSFQDDLWYGREERAAASIDGEGRFEFERVPRRGMTLHIAGERAPRVELELETIADPLDIRVVNPWLGDVQIAVAGAVPQEGSIELRDAEDHALLLCVFGGGSTWRFKSIALADTLRFADGQTPVLSVPETARAAVLLDAQNNVLRRVPVTIGEELVHVTL